MHRNVENSSEVKDRENDNGDTLLYALTAEGSRLADSWGANSRDVWKMEDGPMGLMLQTGISGIPEPSALALTLHTGNPGVSEPSEQTVATENPDCNAETCGD